jgi:hypothetical protein
MAEVVQKPSAQRDLLGSEWLNVVSCAVAIVVDSESDHADYASRSGSSETGGFYYIPTPEIHVIYIFYRPAQGRSWQILLISGVAATRNCVEEMKSSGANRECRYRY